MAETPKKPTAKDVEWAKRQIEHPQPIHLVAELAKLCGPNLQRRRLWRMLVRKGIIEPRDEKNRRVHLVAHSRLMALWPELWFSIRSAWQEATTYGPDEDLAA